RMSAGIRAQAVEKATQRVVLPEGGIGGEQFAVLGVEHENKAHHHSEQAAVDVAGVGPSEPREEPSRRLGVGGLESAKQLPKRAEDLVGEFGGNLVLVLAALAQELRQAAIRRHVQQPVGGEEQRERREQRPSG